METEEDKFKMKWCPDHRETTQHVKEQVEDRVVWVCTRCWDELYGGKYELPLIRIG